VENKTKPTMVCCRKCEERKGSEDKGLSPTMALNLSGAIQNFPKCNNKNYYLDICSQIVVTA
jgi:hypothetical protein